MVHRFAREELYELVWSKPISKLAKELGISDVAIAKACRRADIPSPGVGYSPRVQHGKKVRRTPLPPHTLAPEVQERIARESTEERRIDG